MLVDSPPEGVSPRRAAIGVLVKTVSLDPDVNNVDRVIGKGLGLNEKVDVRRLEAVGFAAHRVVHHLDTVVTRLQEQRDMSRTGVHTVTALTASTALGIAVGGVVAWASDHVLAGLVAGGGIATMGSMGGVLWALGYAEASRRACVDGLCRELELGSLNRMQRPARLRRENAAGPGVDVVIDLQPRAPPVMARSLSAPIVF